MKFFTNLRQYAAILCTVCLLIPPVEARTKQGDKALKEGQKAFAKQDYDSALTYFEEALEQDSREPAYLIAVQQGKEKAGDMHIAQGKKLLTAQKLNEALVQFQKALLIDPSSQIALQLISETNEMVKERTRLPEGAVVLTPAERARQEVEKRINSLEGPPVLRPINNQISSLKMNNQTARVLYESVGKLAGINVLFDPQGIDTLGSTTRNFNLDLNNVTLEEALSYVSLVTHTFWKPISRNAIFVTQESEPKRQEYQDEVVKVFYIQNASTPNEFTEIFNGVRTGAKLSTGIFQVASQNAIIARGSSDTMSIVEKLIHDLDRPKAEVIVDVMVMEVSKSRITTLGAALAGQTGGLNIPITYAPKNGVSSTTGTTTTGTTSTTSTTSTTLTTGTSTSSTSSAILLSRVGKISSGDFQTTLPGALIQALLTDSNSRLLQRPEVRVTDGGKASLKIGSKIPYVSGSLNSAVATPGSIPYATTQFQQVDVGVNIDLQPHVNGPEEVSMHIKVEVSNVTSTETIAGVQQPIIGQKVNEADIRMRDGEVSLLGGLSTDSDSLSTSGIPGLANMPVLGYLFGTRTKDREKDDIVIALVPHIIRAPSVGDQGNDGILAGTERIVRVERRQPPAVATPVTPTPNSPSTPAPAVAPSAPSTPQVPPPVVPPPGGSAALLPPTNNPRMSVGQGPGQYTPNTSNAPAAQIIRPQPAVMTQVPAVQGQVPQPSAAWQMQMMQQRIAAQAQAVQAAQAAQSAAQNAQPVQTASPLVSPDPTQQPAQTSPSDDSPVIQLTAPQGSNDGFDPVPDPAPVSTSRFATAPYLIQTQAPPQFVQGSGLPDGGPPAGWTSADQSTNTNNASTTAINSAARTTSVQATQPLPTRTPAVPTDKSVTPKTTDPK